MDFLPADLQATLEIWADDEPDAREFLETGIAPDSLIRACLEAAQDQMRGVPDEDVPLTQFIAAL